MEQLCKEDFAVGRVWAQVAQQGVGVVAVQAESAWLFGGCWAVHVFFQWHQAVHDVAVHGEEPLRQCVIQPAPMLKRSALKYGQLIDLQTHRDGCFASAALP